MNIAIGLGHFSATKGKDTYRKKQKDRETFRSKKPVVSTLRES